MHYAVEQRNQQLISFLIDDCRVSLESTTFSGYTAYQLAVCVDTGLAQLLATKGALPRDLPDSEDESDSDEEVRPYLLYINQKIRTTCWHCDLNIE